jgi:hypothetical protein
MTRPFGCQREDQPTEYRL